MESNKSSSRCHTAIIPILLPIIADNINVYPHVNVKDYEQYAPVSHIQTDDIDFSKTTSISTFYHRLEQVINKVEKVILIFFGGCEEVDPINMAVNYYIITTFFRIKRIVSIHVASDPQKYNYTFHKWFSHDVEPQNLSKLLKELV